MNQTLTAIDGITVGHATDAIARTGCTVILCPAGATAGVDVRGAAPGTRETEALRPGRLVQKAHAVLLTGGSAFGLDAAGGVVQYLEEPERPVFLRVPFGVPIVPAAVVFDLGVGDAKVRPDREMGYQACLNATGERSRWVLSAQARVPRLVRLRVLHPLKGVSVQRVNILIRV